MFLNIDNRLNRMPRLAWMLILYLTGLALFGGFSCLLHGLISLLGA